MIISIIITYYPDRELLRKNISAFIDHVDKVLIWENTPEQEKLNYRFIEHEKVEYHGDGINSISHGLNYAWKYAKDNGYDYLLVMDQDSLWENFEQYLSQTVYNTQTPQGIWGPSTSSDENIQGIDSVYSVINSGTLVKVSLIDKIGGWNERFTIDGVDDEFCLRSKRMGIGTYRFNECHLKQRYGTPMQVSFMGRVCNLRNDPPHRLYSIFKNFIILIRMYPEADEMKIVFKEYWVSLIKWIFVFEDNRFAKMYAIIRGVLSGVTSKI